MVWCRFWFGQEVPRHDCRRCRAQAVVRRRESVNSGPRTPKPKRRATSSLTSYSLVSGRLQLPFLLRTLPHALPLLLSRSRSRTVSAFSFSAWPVVIISVVCHMKCCWFAVLEGRAKATQSGGESDTDATSAHAAYIHTIPTCIHGVGDCRY